ncbi:MAG TPA: YggT family protein [Alphaproteobacteria bacterium]|nr:YggT family protein [Alphaproteobacteria bacterium]
MDVLLIAALRFFSSLLSIFNTFILIYVVLSWLISFKVLNPYNKLVYMIQTVSVQLIEPCLVPIRRFLPSLNGIDLSPIILLLLINFFQDLLIGFITRLTLS